MRFTSIFSTAIFATTILAAPQSGPSGRHAFGKRNEETDDWAGAVVKAPPQDAAGYITVIGTFNLPGAPANPEDSGVSMWVGMDGYKNGDPVVQAGVDAIVDGDGDMTYLPWVQWTPRPAEYIDLGDFGVAEGDQIKVQITVGKGDTSAVALFSTLNTEETYKHTFEGDSAARADEVEWIVERIHDSPEGNPDGKLMNFGTIHFTDCYASTVSGPTDTNPISANAVAVDMLRPNVDGHAATSTILGEGRVDIVWQNL